MSTYLSFKNPSKTLKIVGNILKFKQKEVDNTHGYFNENVYTASESGYYYFIGSLVTFGKFGSIGKIVKNTNGREHIIGFMERDDISTDDTVNEYSLSTSSLTYLHKGYINKDDYS